MSKAFLIYVHIYKYDEDNYFAMKILGFKQISQ